MNIRFKTNFAVFLQCTQNIKNFGNFDSQSLCFYQPKNLRYFCGKIQFLAELERCDFLRFRRKDPLGFPPVEIKKSFSSLKVFKGEGTRLTTMKSWFQAFPRFIGIPTPTNSNQPGIVECAGVVCDH